MKNKIEIKTLTPKQYHQLNTTLEIKFGFHPTPFGEVIVAVLQDELCYLNFVTKNKDKSISGKQSLELYFKDAGFRGVVCRIYIYDAYMYHVYSGSWHLPDSITTSIQ